MPAPLAPLPLLEYDGVFDPGTAEGGCGARKDGGVGAFGGLKCARGRGEGTLEAADAGSVAYHVNNACGAAGQLESGLVAATAAERERVVLYQKRGREVERGDELFYAYDLRSDDPADAAYRCRCPECAGQVPLYKNFVSRSHGGGSGDGGGGGGGAGAV